MLREIDGFPADEGFTMPAEFSPHDGTIMIYPTRPGSWGKDRTDTLESFEAIFGEILKREKLYLIVSKEYFSEAKLITDELILNESECVLDRQRLRNRFKLIVMESDDAWARDVGPTFVRDGKGRIRGINWRFNAWGGDVDGLYKNWERDGSIHLIYK